LSQQLMSKSKSQTPQSPTFPIAPTAPESPATDIETLLNKMSLADIRKLAKAKGSDARGNRVNIAARLKKIVTESDIWDATA